jgi:hypothetical protein
MELLMRLRTNIATVDDYHRLEIRREGLLTQNEIDKFAKALHLMPTREMVANKNAKEIQEIHTLTKHTHLASTLCDKRIITSLNI